MDFVLVLLCLMFAALSVRSVILLFWPGTAAAKWCGEKPRREFDTAPHDQTRDETHLTARLPIAVLK